MIGFISIAGVVVNDSILLVEFVKYRVKEGMVPVFGRILALNRHYFES